MTEFVCDRCKDHGTIVIDRMILVHCPDCERGEYRRQQFERQHEAIPEARP